METKKDNELSEDFKYRAKAGAFLMAVAGVSSIAGFSRTLATAKRKNASLIDVPPTKAAILMDEGSNLALRALGWGTIIAIIGTGTIFFSIWRISGAKNMDEFRNKMGNILPKVKKNDPPQSRTDFESLTDLLSYVSTWGKE